MPKGKSNKYILSQFYLRSYADKINTICVQISAGHFECLSFVFKASMPTWTALSVLTAATISAPCTNRGVPDVTDEVISLRPACQGQHNNNLNYTIILQPCLGIRSVICRTNLD